LIVEHEEEVTLPDFGDTETDPTPDPDFKYPSAQEAAETHEVVNEAA